MADPIDSRAFRDACGLFPTGVTIVTTVGESGVPVGLTANSFTSVSLDPPMVLFCVGRTSESLSAFVDGGGFAVHLLAAEQQALSNRFASKGVDRFEGVEWRWSEVSGLPVLDGAMAVMECKLAHEHAGGDHVIVVGEVTNLTVSEPDRPALGYFRGSYTTNP